MPIAAASCRVRRLAGKLFTVQCLTGETLFGENRLMGETLFGENRLMGETLFGENRLMGETNCVFLPM